MDSLPFTITRDCLSFLIGGGCNSDTIRATLTFDDAEDVSLGTGNCSHLMERRTLNTSTYKGKNATVVLQDFDSSDPWGHISFDDLTDDPGYCEGEFM